MFSLLFSGNIQAFLPKVLSFRSTLTKNLTSTYMSSRGMGMGAASTAKKGSKKTKPPSSAPFDVSASLLRLDKKYDELMLNAAKILQSDVESMEDVSTTEYVVATRARNGPNDWVPIAQLCVSRAKADAQLSEGSSDPAIRAAVSYYCRELSHVASLGSRAFQSIPRNELQYAVESMDSFHKHVYEVVMEGKNEKASNENGMTKARAREILQISDEVSEQADIKRVYRKLSFEWHPDRFVGKELSDEDEKNASEKYQQIKTAYDTLISGVRGSDKSWYESLGGRARTDFHGPIDLISIAEAKDMVESAKIESAIAGLDRDLVQSFVARSRM